MKEIKIFIRTEAAGQVINKLEESGINTMMVNEIDEITDWNDKRR